MSSGQDSALKAACFTAWNDYQKKFKFENAIRAEYEERIETAQRKLYEYKMQQKGNTKGVLMKQAAKGDKTIVLEVYALLKGELENKRVEEATLLKMKEMEEKMAKQAAAGKENAKSVLLRNLAASDNMLMDTCVESWKQFIIEYKKNKEVEDAVKAAEQKVAEFMKAKSEGAKGIIEKMNSATESGLCEHIMSTWATHFNDIKQAQAFELKMEANRAKMAGFNEKNKKGAMSAGQKAEKIHENALVTHAWCIWQTDTKMERVLRYYQTRIDNKRNQMDTVQTAFKDFASQLENNVRAGTPRNFPNRQQTRKLSKGGDSNSLPNIHQKTSNGSGGRSNRG